MSLSTVINGADTVLATVTGMGSRHKFVRRIPTREELIAQARPTTNGPINVWFISRESTQSEQRDGNLTEFIERHVVIIEAWYSVNDAGSTESTFQDLIEAVRAAFRADQSLGSNPSLVAAPASVRIVDHDKIGPALCHHTILTLPVTEYLSDPAGSL